MRVLEEHEKTAGTPDTTATNVPSPPPAVEVDTEYDLEAAPLRASAAFAPSTNLGAAPKSKPSLKPKPRFGNRFSKKKKKATATVGVSPVSVTLNLHLSLNVVPRSLPRHKACPPPFM